MSAGVRNERKGKTLLVAKQDSRDNYLVAWRSHLLISLLREIEVMLGAATQVKI